MAMMTMAASTPLALKVPWAVRISRPRPCLGAEELPHDGADEREAEADVQAGQDPGEGGWQHHLGGDLPAGGAEDAGIGDQVAVDFPGALEGVEEHPEEDQHDRQQDLGRQPEPEGDDEDRPEHDAGDRVHDLDEGPEDLGQEPDPAQGHSEDDCR